MPSAREFRLRWSDASANGHVRHTVYPELGAEDLAPRKLCEAPEALPAILRAAPRAESFQVLPPLRRKEG